MTAAAPTGHATAPAAPGRLGTPVAPDQAARYLAELGGWRDARRRELDEVDRAALAAPDPAVHTADLTLSLALWKAVADRYQLLLGTWDSGRAGSAEREQLAALIWGRLDTATASGLAVSLPEACRLSDALAAQLRAALGLETAAAEAAARIAGLRAQLERIRDQVATEPAGAAQQAAAERQAGLARRVRELADKAARGGDVGGLLGPLEIEAARFERDLIVDGARRRQDASLLRRVREQRAELELREQALRGLVERCVQTVQPAPRYAVPSVAALGPLPNTRAGLEAQQARLDQVARALSLAGSAYQAALDEHAELAGRLAAYRAKAAATGALERAEVQQAYRSAHQELTARPCRMALARPLVEVFQAHLQSPGREDPA